MCVCVCVWTGDQVYSHNACHVCNSELKHVIFLISNFCQICASALQACLHTQLPLNNAIIIVAGLCAWGSGSVLVCLLPLC